MTTCLVGRKLYWKTKHYLGNLDWHGNLGWHGNLDLHDVLDWHGLLGLLGFRKKFELKDKTLPK